MHTKRYPALLLVFFALAACGGSEAADPVAPATGSEQAAAQPKSADDPSCPVAVPGTSAAVEDADGGAALVFTTTGDVAEVRRRAQEMARMHNEEHAKMGPLPTGGAGSGHDHGSHDHGAAGGQGGAGGGHSGHDMGKTGGGAHAGHAGGMIQTHSHAQVEDVSGGVRIVFHVDPQQTAALREELSKHAQHLSSGRCRM